MDQWCQTVYGRFFLLLSETENPGSVYGQYALATQDAIKEGQLQSLLEDVLPDADVRVMGTGDTIIPPGSADTNTHWFIDNKNDNINNIISQAKLPPVDQEPEDLTYFFILAFLLLGLYIVGVGIALYCCRKPQQEKRKEVPWGHFKKDSTAAPTMEEIQAMMEPAPSLSTSTTRGGPNVGPTNPLELMNEPYDNARLPSASLALTQGSDSGAGGLHELVLTESTSRSSGRTFQDMALLPPSSAGATNSSLV